jgi:predicted 3-demethylubiquinone-9 3-methyltransferase (glyoxalase superfamily)
LKKKKVYIIVYKKSKGEEAISFVFDSFEKAMNSSIWEEENQIPNEKGESESLKICSFYLNKDWLGTLESFNTILTLP